MEIAVMGLDHQTPLDIREKASYTSEKYQRACEYLKKDGLIEEFVILSTCNRSEVYCCSKENQLSHLLGFFSDFHGIDKSRVEKYSFYHTGRKAVEHLLETASGLRSLVIGEDQILGQVRGAHQKSMLLKNTGPVLNRLFFTAITTAKKIKNVTGISKNALSISSIAVKFVQDYFNDNIVNKRILVIGTGKMGQLAVKKLKSLGVNDIFITNRTHHCATEFQKEVKGTQVVPYEDRYHYINHVDVVISCTSSPHYTVTYEKFVLAREVKENLCLIDLAVPRDIDSKIEELEGISLYTIDDLDKVVQKHIHMRNEQRQYAIDVINEYCKEFIGWMNSRLRLEQIRYTHSIGKKLLERQYAYAQKRLKLTSERDKTILRKVIKNTIDCIINPMIEKMKEEKKYVPDQY